MLSIVIPSKNVNNLEPCLQAIWMNESGNIQRDHVIVIDDGLERKPDGPTYIRGLTPFIFSQACNSAIRAAGSTDIVILNDDAILETPGGFTALQEVAMA